MTDRETVTSAWRRIHTDHPTTYHIAFPRSIGRMRHRDFPTLLVHTCRLGQGSKVLEAGCGSGRESLFFTTIGCRCTAVDISEIPLRALQQASAHVAAVHDRERSQLLLVAADIFELPFGDGTFDLVFNSGVFEHYDRATRRCLLDELIRVTRRGGFVALAIPNKRHLLSRWWDWLIERCTDFPLYHILEQDIEDALLGEMSELGHDVVLHDWIDCYDTMGHFPNWLPLRLVAFAATFALPRLPRCLRRKLGTRTLFVMKKL